jgi:hypothetical protein
MPETEPTTPTPEAPAPAAEVPPAAEPEAAPTPAPPKPAEPKKSLEDLLASLDDTARAAILGEVTKARSEAASYRGKLRDAEPKAAEYDRLAEASKSAEDRASEAATKAEKRAGKLLSRAVGAEVRALAAATFADPSDASAFLDLAKYADGEGDVDVAAITTDLTDLLARKPHLGKISGQAPMKPNPAQGRSASAPLGMNEQIAAAVAAGDTRTAIRLKSAMTLKNATS